MQTFEDVFLKISEFFQKNGEPGTSEHLASKIEISAAQISRLRNGKVNVSDNVIDKIFNLLKDQDASFAEEIKTSLQNLRDRLSPSAGVESGRGEAIKPIEDFFAVLAKSKHSILCVDYRDSPQVGTIPYLADVVAYAINKNLSFAMFQPFGSQEKLLDMHEKYVKKIREATDVNEDDTITAQAYFHLFKLAHAVRLVYSAIKTKVNRKDHIVLYEAERKDYSLNAIGMQSRLFYARYELDRIWTTKAFDWVSGTDDRHFFVERSSRDISFDAVRTQFYPVLSCWDKNNSFTLPDNNALDNAYGSQDWNVRWKVYDA